MIYNGAWDPKSQQWTSTISALRSTEAQPCGVNGQVRAFVKISSLNARLIPHGRLQDY